MARITTKRNSLLSIALGSLIATSLTGTAEAGWAAPRCVAQCSKTVIGNSDTKLNNCVKNCDNAKMIDMIYPNYFKLNPDNVERFLNALKAQQSAKQKEQANIESSLIAEKGKKKPNTSKIKDLNKKQEKIIPEINALKKQVEKISGHHKIIKGVSDSDTASSGATSKAPSRPTSALPAGTPSKAYDGPTDLPPSLPSPTLDTRKRASAKSLSTPQKRASVKVEPEATSHGGPPTDMPPALPGDVGSKPPSDLPPSLDAPMKRGTGPGAPPALGKKPLTYAEKQALLKQGQVASTGTATNADMPESPSVKQPATASNKPDTGDMFAEMKKKAAEREKRLSQSGGMSQQPQAQPEQHALTNMDIQRLNRRVAIDPEKAKQEAENSLERAKKAQNSTDIAKYSAELAHVESKIGETEGW